MRKKIIRWLVICKVAAVRLFDEQYTYKASALAFTTILSIVPLLSVLVSLFAISPVFIRYMDVARKYLIENFIPASTTTIDFYLQNFINQATRLPIFSLAFFVYTVVTLIITVEHILNEVWHAPKRSKKILTWVIYWGVLISAPLVLGLSVLISTYIFSISWIAGTHFPFFSLLPLATNTVFFWLLYLIVPNHPIRWQDSLFGAFIAAVLFELAKMCFGFYLKQFPNYEVIYGAIAVVPIFLIWIYISWLIVLYGALVTHTKSEHKY